MFRSSRRQSRRHSMWNCSIRSAKYRRFVAVFQPECCVFLSFKHWMPGQCCRTWDEGLPLWSLHRTDRSADMPECYFRINNLKTREKTSLSLHCDAWDSDRTERKKRRIIGQPPELSERGWNEGRSGGMEKEEKVIMKMYIKYVQLLIFYVKRNNSIRIRARVEWGEG